MLQVQTGGGGPPLTIIGKDLDAGATFNADLNPAANSQALRAGRLMSYDEAKQQLSPWDATADAPGATVFGLLSDDVAVASATDTTTVLTAVMIYREGIFLRQEIESANNVAIPPGSALEKALRDLGIFLEQSYEGYVGLQPVPAGVVPLGVPAPEPKKP